MSDQQTERVERAIEVLVLAPIGFAATLKDMTPTMMAMLVNRGRTEVEHRQQQLQTVKSTGEVAIAFGVPMLREKLNQRIDALRPKATAPEAAGESGASATPGSSSEPLNGATVAAANGAAATNGAVVTSGPRSEDLAIPGYDSLSASQVVERLSGLGPDDLTLIREYELAHRNRRTIIGKIEQLDAARGA